MGKAERSVAVVAITSKPISAWNSYVYADYIVLERVVGRRAHGAQVLLDKPQRKQAGTAEQHTNAGQSWRGISGNGFAHKSEIHVSANQNRPSDAFGEIGRTLCVTAVMVLIITTATWLARTS